MSEPKFSKFETVSLKGHPNFNEKWVQNRIAEDPSILGLGDLVLLNEELIQPNGGRLDLLLYDSESEQRYEVEIQLGRVDESHIIRTIEYWDIEKKRYPQYDHTAVIIAEEITGRFLNIISLFNGHIPLIAIQMKALQCSDYITLDFTKILDRIDLGVIEPPPPSTDRSYWEKQASLETVKIADSLLSLISTFVPNCELNYTKGYIGIAENGVANNFVIFRPKKKFLRMSVKLPKNQEIESKIEESGLQAPSYTKANRYVIRLYKKEISEHSELLTDLLKQAYGGEEE